MFVKRLCSMILTSAMLFVSVMGCGVNDGNGSKHAETAINSEKELSEIYIGVSLGTVKQERWMREANLFQRYADDNNLKMTIQSANDNEQTQLRQCEYLIDDGVDVLIVQSLNASGIQPVIEKAHKAGIKVIAYDRFAMDCEVDYYVTFDSFQVGEAQAQMIVGKIPEGNYIWLKGGREDNNAVLIAEGQRSVLQSYLDAGKITIVQEQWCDGWDPQLAEQYTEQALQQHEVQAVLASNDGICGGAVRALAAKGLDGTVVTCGQDASLAACQRIVAGTQLGTVFKPISLLNEATCELAAALATGEAEETDCIDPELGTWTTLNNGAYDVPTFMIDVYPVDKDNLDEVVIDEYHYHSAEDVYAEIERKKN